MKRVLIILVALFGATTALAAEQVYRGEQTLWQDTVWSGEVLVDGIVTVAPQVTLEVRPGTTVRFTRFDSNGDGIGEHELLAQGRLLIEGTPAEPVLFTSAEYQPRRGDWGALNIMVSDGPASRLEHVTVEYGYRGFHAHFSNAEIFSSTFRNNLRGVQFQESTMKLHDCRIEDNLNGIQFRDSKVELVGNWIHGNYWGLRCVYSDVLLVDNIVSDNLVNGLNLRDSQVVMENNRVLANRRGIYLQRSQGQVSGNLVEYSSEHGLYLEESQVEVTGNAIRHNGRSGVKWIESEGLLRGNDLSDNGTYALYNEGTSDVDARYNWWGGQLLQGADPRIFDGRSREGLGMVDWAESLPAEPEDTHSMSGSGER